jgi:hypothetical protein
MFHALAVAAGRRRADTRTRSVRRRRMRRCTFCREHVGVVLWVFDGVTEYPVPACQACAGRHGLRVYRVEMDEGLLAESPEQGAGAGDGAPDRGAGVQPT